MTDHFPQKSISGNQYIMVGYNYDANSILGHPLKDRTANSMRTAWQYLHNIYEFVACAPNIYLLDNEFSSELEIALKKAKTDYQLVTPYSHRNNLAERAIQTWKNHFKAGLATCDPQFPLTL